MIFDILLLTIFFLLGIFLFYASYKGWNKNYVPHKRSARILKEVIGYNGIRVVTGLIGSILILIPSLIFFNKVIGIKAPKRMTSKSELVFLTPNNDNDQDKSIHFGDRSGDLNLITEHIKYSSPEIRDNYIRVSFKDNYLEEVPEIIFKLQNLEEIDLTNNDIESLPINQIKSLKKLRKIILINNPISPENLNQIKQLQYIQIVK
jgi:hypothetical protein